MNPQSFSLILQHRVTPSDTSACVGYPEVPLVQPVRVLLIGDDAVAADVNRLFAALSVECSALARGGQQICGGPADLGCWATDTPAVRNVLIVVAGRQPPDPAFEGVVDGYLDSEFDAIGIVREGSDPVTVLPRRLKYSLATSWESDIREVAAELVDSIVFGSDERRVFVSYSRRDGAPTAERLAGILAEYRFDVFLDRFRIAPGADLLQRISDELVDKAMVVVVETEGSAASPWVRYEVSTATSRRLGVAAVNLGNHSMLQSIGEAARCRIDDDDELATFVLSQHRAQLTEKRRSLLQSVWRSLSSYTPPADVSPTAGGFRVLTSSGVEYAVAVHTRPADLHRFRLAHERAGGARSVILHPQPRRPDRRRDLGWLGNEVGIAIVDEGRIDEAAREIGAGTL